MRRTLSIPLPSSTMDDTRLTDLEIRLTHQEATLQTLNDVVADQQQLIAHLRKEVEALKARVRDLAPANIAAPWEEPPPPHYCAGTATAGRGTSRPSTRLSAATPNNRKPRSASGGGPATQTMGLPCASPMISGRPDRIGTPSTTRSPSARTRSEMKSRPPAAVPPENTSKSAEASARLAVSTKASKSSRMMPPTVGSPPASRTAALSITALLSRIRPGRNG